MQALHQWAQLCMWVCALQQQLVPFIVALLLHGLLLMHSTISAALSKAV